MNKIIPWTGLIGIFLISYDQIAYALGISAVGSFMVEKNSYTYSFPHGTGGNTVSDPYSVLGGGFILDTFLVPQFALALGVLYASRASHLTVNITSPLSVSTNQSFAAPFVLTPLTLRYFLFPYLAVEAGGYFGFGIDKSSTYENQNLSRFDYGGVGGLAFNYPVHSKISLIVNADFYFGIPNAITTFNESVLNYRDFISTFGLRLSI